MTEEPPERERKYDWDDPGSTAAAARRMDGLSFLQAMLAGDIPPPPITHTLGFTLREVESGRAVFELEPAEFHYNPIGSVHGGVYATLLDSACGCAIHSTLALGEAYTTLDLTTKFLRAVSVDTGRLRAVGSVVYRGSRMGLTEARLVDDEDTVYGHATSSILIFPVR